MIDWLSMHRLSARVAVVVLCSLAGLLVAGTSLAQQPPSEEVQAEARARLREGVKAYEAKRYKDAVDAFLAANRLVPNPGLSFNTAKAYEKLGDSAGALSFFRDYLRRAPDASDRADVERKIKRFEQRLQTKNVMQVTILSEPEGGTVVLDGQPVGVTPWTGEIVPGEHSFKIKREGYRDHVHTFQLPREHALDVKVELEVAPPEPPPQAAPERETTSGVAPADEPPDRPARRRDARVSVPTWVVLGAGAAALGTALGFEVMRRSAESKAEDAPTQLEAIEQYETMEDRRNIARIAAGIGGAALLTGAVLLYFDLNPGSDDSASARRVPRTGRSLELGYAHGGIMARGRF
jgi:tetratricopeptide (TPR) repeat protein